MPQPPHVSIRTLRERLGITIADLAKSASAHLGRTISSGTISAIETGQRGASSEMLAALAAGLGVAPDSVTTSYRPRKPRVRRDPR